MERLTEKDAYWMGEEFWVTAKEPDDEEIDAVYEKLKEYEDAEEQGLLLRLPCKVGDTVYLVDFEEKTWDEATVNSIKIDTRDNRVLINSDYEVGTWSEDSYVFYSKEEAEQALARREKENG